MKKIIAAFFVCLMLAFSCYAAEYDGYIVKIKDNTAEQMTDVSLFSDTAFLFSDIDDSGVVELLADELPDVSEINAEHMLVKALDEASLNELIDMGIVESYEQDIYLELFDYDVTANASYQSQKWYLDAINADYAWNSGIYGNGVKVAVVDSGVYPNEDIKNNLLTGHNYYEKDANYDHQNTYDYSSNSHGTMVAGFIAAECNSLSTVGISFNAKIVPLRVTDGSTFSLSYAVSAIYDAVDDFDCDVINLSFGTTSESESMRNAINHAIEKGAIVVAASGNKGEDISNPKLYPACFPEVISVANAQKSGDSFSIYKSSTYNEYVDIAAPGTNVISLSNSTSGTRTLTGTSFSSPIVAASAALAKSVDPTITQSAFESLIKSTANKSYIESSKQNSDKWGEGMLDIEAMIKQLFAKKEVAASEIITENDETYINLTNTNKVYPIDSYLLIYDYDDSGKVVNAAIKSVNVGINTTVKYSLTQNGFSKNADVKVFSNYMPGDVNGDKSVNTRDASALLRYLVGKNDSAVIEALDFNDDDEVSLRDASAILRYLVYRKE